MLAGTAETSAPATAILAVAARIAEQLSSHLPRSQREVLHHGQHDALGSSVGTRRRARAAQPAGPFPCRRIAHKDSPPAARPGGRSPLAAPAAFVAAGPAPATA